ncbi:uncharacterized protein EDB93DRAFT_1107990 [Suillus bovinus]|uniref:uncharacterized protein n=1 Tax=Suillus bovinus TaxID=48563 RepID=UPI001B85F855|nr:uncharacterized protein EDB93DRAFT_1107990 [Suillus bovinus]KAG2131989.1 hypothetical protein EDB93DRAFT_1107990 [Suillus bovinus]
MSMRNQGVVDEPEDDAAGGGHQGALELLKHAQGCFKHHQEKFPEHWQVQEACAAFSASHACNPAAELLLQAVHLVQCKCTFFSSNHWFISTVALSLYCIDQLGRVKWIWQEESYNWMVKMQDEKLIALQAILMGWRCNNGRGAGLGTRQSNTYIHTIPRPPLTFQRPCALVQTFRRQFLCSEAHPNLINSINILSGASEYV